MKRYDHASGSATAIAAAAHSGGPEYPQLGSVIPPEWHTDVQEELISVITAAGMSPDGLLRNQLATAINTLISNSSSGISATRGQGQIMTSFAADSAHDIIFEAGIKRNSADDGWINLSANITKQLDAAWATGDNAGGLPSNLTPTADETYHCFIITNGTTVDAGFDTSLTASNLQTATGWGADFRYARAFSYLTDGSANWIQGRRVERSFYLATHIDEYIGDGSSSLLQISTPSGIVTKGLLFGSIYKSTSSGGTVTTAYLKLFDGTLTSSAGMFIASSDASNAEVFGKGSGAGHAMTNTSSQIGFESGITGVSLTISLTGYEDINL